MSWSFVAALYVIAAACMLGFVIQWIDHAKAEQKRHAGDYSPPPTAIAPALQEDGNIHYASFDRRRRS